MKVYVTRKVDPIGIKILKDKGYTVDIWDSHDMIPPQELIKAMKNNYDGLFCMLTDQIGKEVLDAAGSQLKGVCTMSVGYEHLDLEELKKRKIVAANCSTASSDCVSEFAVGLVLLASRRILDGYLAVKNKEWGPWRPMWMLGFELIGKTVGIVGLGKIGFGIAQRINAFKIAKLLYHDMQKVSYDKDVNAEFVPLDNLLNNSDVVCLSCNLTKETRNMFNKDTFKKMKKTAILVNVGRGGVINQDDLVKALREEVITAACLDVTDPEPLPYDHPLMSLKNCVIVPHIASSTVEARRAMSELTANNMISILSGKEPTGNIKM
ncbi:glyoxylate reductase/hydroxypyruvate reductase-like [Argonauta hians]